MKVARRSRAVRARHGYRVHAIWWRGVTTGAAQSFGIAIHRKAMGREGSLHAWLTRTQLKRLRDALSEALR